MKQTKIATIATIALIAIISYPSIDGFLISHDPTVTRSRFTLYSSFGSPRDYFGEPGSSFMLKEFSEHQDLKDIVSLASQSLPERPDGIVTVAKFTSSINQDCIATEGQYEALARNNPATLFLRCFAEYENADLLLGQASVSQLPTYDIFYGGERVARVEGNDALEVEDVINRFQLLNSKLDLFSEDADNQRRLAWGEGKIRGNTEATPKTTARFIPGYDWNTAKGAFDEAADKAQKSFEESYGNWLPNLEDN